MKKLSLMLFLSVLVSCNSANTESKVEEDGSTTSVSSAKSSSRINENVKRKNKNCASGALFGKNKHCSEVGEEPPVKVDPIVDVGHPVTCTEDQIEFIRSGSPFLVKMKTNSGLGTIIAGEKYEIIYDEDSGSFAATGDNSYYGRVVTYSYKNADLEKCEISLWGAKFYLDENNIAHHFNIKQIQGHVEL